jgi:hypothetical protein
LAQCVFDQVQLFEHLKVIAQAFPRARAALGRFLREYAVVPSVQVHRSAVTRAACARELQSGSDFKQSQHVGQARGFGSMFVSEYTECNEMVRRERSGLHLQ